MRSSVLALASALSLFGAAVSAQTGFTAGAPVTGSGGEPIGVVQSEDGDVLFIRRPDGSSFGLPKAGFRVEGAGVVAAWSRAEIEQAVAAQAPAEPQGVLADTASVRAGMAVRGDGGAAVGAVADLVLEGSALKTVMIKPSDGGPVFGLPGGSFRVVDGALVSAWTKQEIDQARGPALAAGVPPTPENVKAGMRVVGESGFVIGAVRVVESSNGAVQNIFITPVEGGREFGLPAGGFKVRGGDLVAAWTKAEIDAVRNAAR